MCVSWFCNPACSPPSCKRHDKFYFKDGSVVLKIENTLYRIHKSLLVRDSELFAQMFTLPSGADERVEGVCDENPIELRGQDKIEFDCFLSFYYPDGTDILTFLRVADKYQFETQKAAALEVLRVRGTPAERIITARKFEEVREWLVPAFEELMENLTPPRRAEGLLLGNEDLLNLWYIQSYRARNGNIAHVRVFIRHLVLKNGTPDTVPFDISPVKLF